MDRFDELFLKWQKEYHFQAFIKDGIVDPERYVNPHILFVLRDMNWQTDRDLRLDLRDHGSGWKTWNNIGRWTKALLDGDEEYPYDMNTSQRVEQLRHIAVLNLKKEGGVSRAHGDELLEAVKTQHDLILEEICLCDPKIIICCGLSGSGMLGNADLLKDYIFPETSEWMQFHSCAFDRDWWYYYADIHSQKIPIISFCHPHVTNLSGCRGHEDLFKPLYKDMLEIRRMFL